MEGINWFLKLIAIAGLFSIVSSNSFEVCNKWVYVIFKGVIVWNTRHED